MDWKLAREFKVKLTTTDASYNEDLAEIEVGEMDVMLNEFVTNEVGLGPDEKIDVSVEEVFT